MLQEIESMARNSRAIILESEMKAPPGDIRGEMGLNNESVLHLRRVRERDGLKFGLYTSWTAGVTMPSDPGIFETTPRLSFSERTDLSSPMLPKPLRRSWQRIRRQRHSTWL